MSNMLRYIETRNLTSVEQAWAALAIAVLSDYIKDGCNPPMEDDWFRTLCFIANINPGNLQAKIEFIYGPNEDKESKNG